MVVVKWIGVVILVILGLLAAIAAIGASLPEKHTATRSATFPAPPERVWAVIAGPPTWRPGVMRYQELPPQDGHRVWVEFGKGGSKMAYEVVESEPPRKLVTRIADPHLPFGGTWTYVIEPADGGSRLTITENGEVYNPIFRFISRYVMGYNATMDRYLQALGKKLESSGS